MTDLVYDNWGVAHEIDRLYEELPKRYWMITSAGQGEVSEPIGWDQVQIVHRRDPQYHGFNYEFTDEEIELRFDSECGLQEIEDEYSQYGPDGLVLLRKEVIVGITTIIEYQGRLNLNTRKRVDGTVTCMVERNSLHQLIGARLDTKLNLQEGKTLDDVSFTPPILTRCYLPSRVISQSFENKVTVAESANYQKAKDGDLWINFNTSAPKTSQIDKFIGRPLNVVETNPTTNGDCLFKFAAKGSYTFTIHLSYRFQMSIQPRMISFGKKITGYSLKTLLILKKASGATHTYPIAAEKTGAPNETHTGNLDVEGTLSGALDVEIGDELYIIGAYTFTHNANEIASLTATVTSYVTEIELTGNSVADATVTEGLLIRDVLATALKKITGQDDVFRSTYYGLASDSQPEDGCGALRVITNGGRIRNATGGKFPLTVSFKEQLADLHAIDGIGMGYEWDGTLGRETIRIEPMGYFYRDVEIMALTDHTDYREETARELLFNQIEVGYERYNEEDSNSLDEAHAYHEYQTPIQTEKNKYSIKSKTIASAYLLETTRRAQFAKDEKQGTSYDDANFIVHAKAAAPQTLSIGVSNTGAGGTSPVVNFGGAKPLELKKGNRFTISGSQYNDGTYTVTYIEDQTSYDPPLYLAFVTPAFVQGEAIPAAQIIFYEYEPVHDEPFDTVTGLIAPDTAYNLTLTPKRMLLTHSPWLLSGLTYKEGVRQIKNTFTKQNGELTTQLSADYPCPRGDRLGLSLLEKGDIALQAFGYAESLFSPEWIFCKTRLSKQQVRYLISALRGMNGEDKNYGYVSLADERGSPVQGWVYELTYNPTKEEASLKLLKKKIRDFTP